jgi:hypothetical protein
MSARSEKHTELNFTWQDEPRNSLDILSFADWSPVAISICHQHILVLP